MPFSPWYTDRRNPPRSKSANFLASILSLLLPSFSKAFLRGSHTTTFVTCGLSRSYNHAAQVPSSKVTCKSPPSPRINCRMVIALVFEDGLHHQFPRTIHHCDRNCFF